MSFIADRQSIDDLNLLGKYRAGSIYGLFNKVQTRGGEKLLDEMFREPLTDPSAINQRSGVFLYLQDKDYGFPFSREQFGVVEDYLGAGSAGNILTTMAGVFRRRLMEGLVKDEAYGHIREAVRTTVSFIQTCRNFIGRFDEQEAPELLGDKIRTVKEILDDKRLTGLPREEETGDLSWQKVAVLHHLFVHVLELEMGRLCEILCYLDCCIAVSKVAADRGFSYAHALPEDEYMFHAADLRHPGLDKAVGNTISLDQDRNVLFLTGANMAGKSTFMKSFGIAL